jgi:hypothetical protein
MFVVWPTAKATLPVEAIGKVINAAIIIETAIVLVGTVLTAVLFIDKLYSWKHITRGTDSKDGIRLHVYNNDKVICGNPCKKLLLEQLSQY